MTDRATNTPRLFYGLSIVLIIGHLIHSFFKGHDETYASATISGLMTPILVTPFALWHGYLRYGAMKMFIFFMMVFVISWSYESLSIATGFPFGHYHYTDLLGAKLGTVPITIMPAYFAFGYLAWVLGDVLLSKRDNTIRGGDLIMAPLVASFIMVVWDITMDPINSTITKMWIWHDGGAYFGVPFVNYLGWFLCVFTFYFAFSLFNMKRNEDATPAVTQQRMYWTLPAFMYATIIAEYFAGMLGRQSYEVTSEDQHVWWTGDIYGSMTLVSLFTVLPIFIFCLYRLSKDFSKA